MADRRDHGPPRDKEAFAVFPTFERDQPEDLLPRHAGDFQTGEQIAAQARQMAMGQPAEFGIRFFTSESDAQIAQSQPAVRRQNQVHQPAEHLTGAKGHPDGKRADREPESFVDPIGEPVRHRRGGWRRRLFRRDARRPCPCARRPARGAGASNSGFASCTETKSARSTGRPETQKVAAAVRASCENRKAGLNTVWANSAIKPRGGPRLLV